MKISEKFKELRERKEAALIGFITAGDPTIEDTIKIADTLIKNGVDILELGLPFSDPVADGPVIQKAGERALKEGINTDKYFETAKKITGAPKACMTYYNLVLKRGLDKFAKDCAESDISGLIIPDMPIEESEELHEACSKHGVDLILFAAPTTTKERLRKNIKAASGFLYLVSVTGVTGDRKELPTELTNLIKETKKESGTLPVAVGFGISKPEQIKEILSAGADAVIVGSAFIRIIEENIGDKNKILTKLAQYTKELKEATY
jgi:tryptophan synthase alpha chain